MTTKVQDIAAKTVGTIKAAKATLEGLRGVFRHLEREHAEVSTLLVRLRASSDSDMRRELLPTIRRELIAHEEAETAALYPVLRGDARTRSLAEEHDADADELKTAVAALVACAVDSPEWQPTLDDLIAQVKRHVSSEEQVYFPKAQEVFGARADELLTLYEQAKARAMRELNATP